ncbi:hypothetical protein [Aeoliella sp.]|uniref:hypothetical protein n=1 Tax=Aeoliella sp. TaxID=2795800 RepID=UPI003CCBED11
MDPLRIEIGGQRSLEGWINLGVRDNGFDIITDEIPFDDVTMFYWAHVIEHLPFACVRIAVQRMYDKLVPGGILRTITPDLHQICVAYVNKDVHAFTSGENRWSTFSEEYEQLGIGGMFIAQIVNSQPPGTRDENKVHNNKGINVADLSHVGGYDFEMLEKLFLSVGFSRVERTGFIEIDRYQNRKGQLLVNAIK